MTHGSTHTLTLGMTPGGDSIPTQAITTTIICCRNANYNYVPYDPGAPLPPEYDPGASAPPPDAPPVADVPNSGQDSQPPSAPGANFATQVQLYLKDGTTYTVGDYWFSGDELHYRLSDNSEHTITIEQLDVQRTVDENARHGVTFTLKPAPNA